MGFSSLIAAPTIGDRFDVLKQGYEREALQNGVAADAARSDLLKKYAAALQRLKAEDRQIAGKPLREAAVDAELATVDARLKGEELVVKKADPPPFTFPASAADWQQAPGEEIKIDMSDKETRLGKPIGIKVRKGDRIRVIPNPVDKIKRGSLAGDWRGIDRGWMGIRIHQQTGNTNLKTIGKNDFLYTAKADGELAVYIYTWDTIGSGTFRIKFLNLDAPDESPEARLPTSFVNLKKKGDDLLEATEAKAARASAKTLEIYGSALRQLARDAKAKQDPLLRDIEKEIARVGANEEPSLIYESDPFRRPETAEEWEALPGKVIVVAAADNDWRGENGKRVGLAVAKGDKVRLVAHPADLWGRRHAAMGTWNSADRCSLKVGIVGQTAFEGVSSGSSDTGAIYDCQADGQLAFQTYVWATSGGVGKIRFKLQPLAKDPVD